MDSLQLQQQKWRNKDEEKQPSPPSSPPTSTSPSHEFSFTISLHHPPPPPPSSSIDKSKNLSSSSSSIALDLSPADDIFFHGHLLPLHLLSHLPVSPRSSTNSMDSFTLPIKDLLAPDPHHHHHHQTTAAVAAESETKKTGDKEETRNRGTTKSSSKSFSWLSSKWRKDMNHNNNSDGSRSERQQQKKRKIKLDVSDLLKRYMRMVRPFLSFRNSNGNRRPERAQSYSYSSGNLSFRRKQEDYFYKGRRKGGGELFSAPASMRTSPTNSGLLVATAGGPNTTSHDSTMEELQAAIQAAIAHCKNSIAVVEDKIQLPS